MIEIFYVFVVFVFIVSGFAGFFTFVSDMEERVSIHRNKRHFTTREGSETVEQRRMELFEETIGNLLHRTDAWTMPDRLYGNEAWQFGRTRIICGKDPKNLEMTHSGFRVWLSYEEKRILFHYFDFMKQVRMGNISGGPNTLRKKEEMAYETIS